MDNPVALVLSGGVSLGAYQAGAFATLSKRVCPNWIAASSAGAINAAVICGNKPEYRLEALSRFWMLEVRDPSEQAALTEPNSSFGHALSWISALQTRLTGSPGFFRPSLYSLIQSPPALYDLTPMQTRLQELIDFDRLNAGEIRLTVATTDVETSETVLFDTARGDRIEMPHLMASCGLLPEFAPVEIDGRLLGDGGLSANAPVEAVLTDPNLPNVCFVVDLFARDGGRPTDLETSLARRQEIFFANQTYQQIRSHLRMLDQRSSHSSRSPIIFYMSYRPLAGEAGPEKQYDFSERTLRARWRAGALDMDAALASFADDSQEGGLRTIRRGAT
jgi:NTE family protein